MTLLERFRAQPRQKHAEPSVRLAFVQELPITERDVLTEMAREDPDPRVRRAAVAKLIDPPALASVAGADADETVRDQAVAMLRDIALDVFEGVTEAESLAAVEMLADPRALAVVAKSAASEAVAQRARARITDQHVLGSIARHAEHEAVRRAAFEAVGDQREVLSIALNSEFREPALSAVDRIADREDLEHIAARARNKNAAKRARALVREIEERETAERNTAAAAAKAAADAEREARLQAAHAETAAREEAERQAVAERGEAVRVAASQATAEADALQAERARQQAERDRERREAAERDAERTRTRLGELAEEASRAVALEDARAARRQFQAVRREWADLTSQTAAAPEAVEKYADAESQFAVRETAAKEQDQHARREALVRLQQLAARVEPLSAREDLSLKSGERALRDVRAALGAMPQLPSKQDYDEIMHRLKAAQSALTPKVQELREVAGWQRWANVGIQEQLAEKMEALKAVDDPEQIAHHVKDLQQQWRQAADVPRAQGEVLWHRFKAAHDEVWAKCEAHFAAQSEARAANLAKKLALCERAEALSDSTNWIQTAEEIKKLQAEWKTIGPVSRGQEKAIWERFRSACDKFFTRRHADLAERKTVWAANLAKKEALIARVESLAESTDWDATANEIKRIQNEWKTIGPVKKSRSEALWQKFRAACDLFFARYASRFDIARAERVTAREAIVAELETLAGTHASSPAAPVTDTSGMHRTEALGTEAPGIEAPGTEAPSTQALDTLAPDTSTQHPAPSTQHPFSPQPPADLATKVRDIRSRYNVEVAQRGVDRDRANALDDRFAAAFNRIMSQWPGSFAGTDLDPEANRKRMESLVKRMEDLAASVAGPAGAAGDDLSPTTKLAAMLRDALAANTIGGKAADTDSRLRAANEEVRQAQASWSRIGFVPEPTRRTMVDRFQRAIKKIADKAGRAGMAGAGASAGKR